MVDFSKMSKEEIDKMFEEAEAEELRKEEIRASTPEGRAQIEEEKRRAEEEHQRDLERTEMHLKGIETPFIIPGREVSLQEKLSGNSYTVNDLEEPEKKRDINLDLSKLHPVFQAFWRDYGQCSEASKEYVLSALLTSFSVLLGNKVRINVGFGLYPNLYMLLVGNSTFQRKTTALGLGTFYLNYLHKEKKELWRKEREEYKKEKRRFSGLTRKQQSEVEPPERPIDRSYIYPKEGSAEKFLEKIQDRPDGLFYYSEMGGLLARLEASYMTGFKEKITEFYDGNTVYDREIKKDDEVLTIYNPTPSLLAASTFEWLQAHLNVADLFSGFLSRFCFVVRRTYPDINIALLPPIEAKEMWITFHRKLSELSGVINLSPEARDLYTEWYIESKKKILEKDPCLHSFLGRMQATCLKFAAIHHGLDVITMQSEWGTLSAKQLEYALFPWEEFFSLNIESCYQEITKSVSHDEERILTLIRKRGQKEKKIISLSISNLMKFAHMKKRDLMEVLETMVLKKVLVVDKVKSHTYARIKSEENV